MTHLILRGSLLDEAEAELGRNFTIHRLSTPEELNDLQVRGKVEALVTGGSTGACRRWLDKLPALTIVAINGVGTDSVDLEAARKRGIAVTTTPGVLTVDVAEAAVALLLSSTRLVSRADAFVRAGDWEKGHHFPLGTRLAGKRVGIVGAGKIGSEIARLLCGFNVELGYLSRSSQVAGARHFALLNELAEWSDILICTVAATAETRNMIGASVLERLGPKGLFINISRGGVVSEAEMIEVLRDGRLGGAALDVFSDEPFVPQALRDMPNVVLTPHIGSASLEARLAMSNIVVRNVLNRDHRHLLVGLVAEQNAISPAHPGVISDAAGQRHGQASQ